MTDWVNWPSWVGSVSSVGLLLVVLGSIVIAYIKVWPVLLQARIGERHQERLRQDARIAALEQAVKDCHEDWGRETARLRDIIGDLEERIYGLRKQHVQEQISLINAIIESVDNPILKKMLKALESVRQNLPEVSLVTNEEGAKDEAGK